MNSTPRKFEAHITCPREASREVEVSLTEGWVFSAIDGDPVMGKQAYCYLTAYDTDAQLLLERVTAKAAYLRLQGVEVLREKIEEIIYDTKTGVDCIAPCCGNCGAP
jgi:hypothetical protein